MDTILITGAKGQLGHALMRYAGKDSSMRFIPVDLADADITVLDEVIRLVREAKPDILINCAAYTAVDQAESDADRAFLVNAVGPKNLSIASFDLGIPMVQISTDYVFDGSGAKDRDGRLRPYRESDPISPQTVYGRTKRLGELMTMQHNPRHYIIRTAWLYGEGHNFVRTMLRLASGKDPVRVVDDQTGSPTSADELAKAILALIRTGQYGLYHGTCEGACTWYDFTKEIYRLKGIRKEVLPISTEDYPTPARRPAYSVLENYLLDQTTKIRFASWQDAIRNYLCD
ncbi:MAG TPA: dTDP-4-dehydrorhamnose reductase [Clostridiales bacterium]|jgi:dTDP-4-dehydrorhamnose reductase|nr:dTDP-4-dehydrorhamnose reductase [Clostridiales bacterium]